MIIPPVLLHHLGHVCQRPQPHSFSHSIRVSLQHSRCIKLATPSTSFLGVSVMEIVLVSLNAECCTAQPTAHSVYRSPLISSITKLNGCCKKIWLATVKKTSELSQTSRTKYGTIPWSSRERFSDVEEYDIQKNHGSHAAVWNPDWVQWTRDLPLLWRGLSHIPEL